ncbi:hypothetical protein U1Q18_000724 [Sarracenia purpurea var. burkii]
MDGVPLTAHAAVAGQASNECRGVSSPVSERGGIAGEDGIGVKHYSVSLNILVGNVVAVSERQSASVGLGF